MRPVVGPLGPRVCACRMCATVHAHVQYLCGCAPSGAKVVGWLTTHLVLAGAGVSSWGRERALACSGGFICVSITVTNAKHQRMARDSLGTWRRMFPF